jgi:hypothetical protein
MDIKKIRSELEKIMLAPFINKTDKQLWSYQELSDKYKERMKGQQPEHLRKYNQWNKRVCKLNPQQVIEIRSKYNPYVYGKDRLAKEYGVSKSVIKRIIEGHAWKDVKT